jgi:hypothetical protein
LVSPWLERLNIMGCDIPISWKRDSPLGMRIATPRLRYLHLSDSEDYYAVAEPGIEMSRVEHIKSNFFKAQNKVHTIK